jgi:hypothetical protein
MEGRRVCFILRTPQSIQREIGEVDLTNLLFKAYAKFVWSFSGGIWTDFYSPQTWAPSMNLVKWFCTADHCFYHKYQYLGPPIYGLMNSVYALIDFSP